MPFRVLQLRGGPLEQIGDDLRDPRLQVLQHPGRKCQVDQLAHARVVRRVHIEQPAIDVFDHRPRPFAILGQQRIAIQRLPTRRQRLLRVANALQAIVVAGAHPRMTLARTNAPDPLAAAGRIVDRVPVGTVYKTAGNPDRFRMVSPWHNPVSNLVSF